MYSKMPKIRTFLDLKIRNFVRSQPTIFLLNLSHKIIWLANFFRRKSPSGIQYEAKSPMIQSMIHLGTAYPSNILIPRIFNDALFLNNALQPWHLSSINSCKRPHYNRLLLKIQSEYSSSIKSNLLPVPETKSNLSFLKLLARNIAR